MPKRSVTLIEQHVRLIEVLVASGRYRNAAEAVGEALGLLEQCEASGAACLSPNSRKGPRPPMSPAMHSPGYASP